MTMSCKCTAFFWLVQQAWCSLFSPGLHIAASGFSDDSGGWCRVRRGGGRDPSVVSSGWGSGPSGDPSCCKARTVPKRPSLPGRPWQPPVAPLSKQTKGHGEETVRTWSKRSHSDPSKPAKGEHLQCTSDRIRSHQHLELQCRAELAAHCLW